MKKLILLLIFVAGSSLAFSQNGKLFSSGDADLDNAIKNVTTYGRTKPDMFQKTLVAKYNITEAQAADYFASYPAGDAMMILETAKGSGKTNDEVFKAYNANRGKKGWEATLSDLGVKQNGKTFENIKEAMINNGLN